MEEYEIDPKDLFQSDYTVLPGFEILKDGVFGTVYPVVRGLKGSEHIRVMLNGHLVNNPLSGAVFSIFAECALFKTYKR